MLTDAEVVAMAAALLDASDTAALRLCGPLAGGRSNSSWLIDHAGKRYVLRARGHNLAPALADIADEAAIWRHAGGARIAPGLVGVDRERGVLMSEFVNGEHDAPATLSATRLASMCRALTQIHRLPLVARELDYQVLYTHYARAAGCVALPAETARLLGDIERTSAAGLCHHDPVPGNVIFRGDTVSLIDWEYAARGRPIFDFAAVVVDWQQDPSAVAELAGLSADALAQACAAYRQLCAWWAAATHDRVQDQMR